MKLLNSKRALALREAQERWKEHMLWEHLDDWRTQMFAGLMIPKKYFESHHKPKEVSYHNGQKT